MRTISRPPVQRSAASVDPYSRLVALPVHAENIFHFPDGLPAFESSKEFVFLCKPNTRPFFFMQSIDTPDLTFVCIDPFLICPDYAPRISELDVRFLHLESMNDALVVSIITASPRVEETTANLQGPVVINIRACLCKQVICDSQNYPVRYRIWDALNRLDEKERVAATQRNRLTEDSAVR